MIFKSIASENVSSEGQEIPNQSEKEDAWLDSVCVCIHVS